MKGVPPVLPVQILPGDRFRRFEGGLHQSGGPLEFTGRFEKTALPSLEGDDKLIHRFAPGLHPGKEPLLFHSGKDLLRFVPPGFRAVLQKLEEKGHRVIVFVIHLNLFRRFLPVEGKQPLEPAMEVDGIKSFIVPLQGDIDQFLCLRNTSFPKEDRFGRPGSAGQEFIGGVLPGQHRFYRNGPFQVILVGFIDLPHPAAANPPEYPVFSNFFRLGSHLFGFLAYKEGDFARFHSENISRDQNELNTGYLGRKISSGISRVEYSVYLSVTFVELPADFSRVQTRLSGLNVSALSQSFTWNLLPSYVPW